MLEKRNWTPIAASFMGAGLILFVTFVLLGTVSPAQALTCDVPATYSTIQAAVSDPACDVVDVAPGTYMENVSITRSLTIRGASVVSTTVDGAPVGSVFTIVTPTTAVTLTRMTVANGNGAFGGGVMQGVGGTLWISDVLFLDNQAGMSGGAIYSVDGQVTVLSSAFEGNMAQSVNGGAIYQAGVTGTLFVGTSAFLANHAAFDGGAIYNSAGALTVTESVFNDNDASRFGGGIANENGSLTVTDSDISDNVAFTAGGGLYNLQGMTVQRTTIASNTVSSGTGRGGGVANNGVTVVDASTLYGNVAIDGGGLFNGSSGTLTVTNSTISDNNANGGGGLQNRGTSNLVHATVADNDALGGGGILNISGSITLANSLIGDNPTGGDCVNSSGSIMSLGNNLDSDGSCNLTQVGDQPNQSPLLGPLQDNGGPAWTRALLTGSPAIDAALNLYCLPTDQRNQPRPVGPACDIGAYEASYWIYLPAILKP